MADYIVQHEDWQGQEFVAFINSFLKRKGRPPAPPISEVSGQVNARVNQGRWLADCITEGCGGAVVVSRELPLFYCPECANGGNGGKWLNVKLPNNKVAIEVELLKRPARDPFRALHRNWGPGESLASLRAENKRMGVSD